MSVFLLLAIFAAAIACHSAECGAAPVESTRKAENRDANGNTPLLNAFNDYFGHDRSKPSPDVVWLPIAHGADVNGRNGIIRGGASQLSGWRYVKVNQRRAYNMGYTSVHEIISQMPELFLLCVEYGADLDMTEELGKSLIHYAADSTPELLDWFIDHCGNIHA